MDARMRAARMKIQKASWWTKLISDSMFNRLYPKNKFAPFDRAKLEKRGLIFGVAVEVYVKLGWKDRIRLLFSGNAIVETVTFMNVQPKKMESASLVSVLPPRPVANLSTLIQKTQEEIVKGKLDRISKNNPQ